ncbi:MAG: vitamin K epoxide reductase family protein [Patescibacteria group bacterium]|nr:vitamin K epoxide reductase family protein [Patescibacteria group bacterium]
MTNLSKIFNLPPHRPHHKWLVPILAILALIGFCDSAYLSAEHFLGAIPPCTLQGCETVLSSGYSVIFGIPIALMGALYYFALLIMYLLYFEARDIRALNFAMHLSVLGLICDIWFVSAQAFVIHAWCQYCLLSAFVSTVIFVLSYWSLFGEPRVRLEK